MRNGIPLFGLVEFAWKWLCLSSNHSFLSLLFDAVLEFFFFFNVLHYYIQCFCIVCNNDFYYPTVFIIVQKARETSKISHDIVQLVIVQYRARAHPVTLVVFFQFP